MISTQRVLNIEAMLRLKYGPRVSVGLCIFRRDHLVVFTGTIPLFCGTADELTAELL